ncbi:MAG TPA: zinc ribbon domain-containing protein [Blastocatellia bacterium]
MKSCPKCGAENRRTATECRLCATPLDASDNIVGASANSADETGTAAAPVDSSVRPAQEGSQGIGGDLICPNCQGINDPDWLFCQQCGNRLKVPDTADGMESVAAEAPEPPPPSPAEAPALSTEQAGVPSGGLNARSPNSRVSAHLPPAPYTKPERPSPLPPDHLFEPASFAGGGPSEQHAQANGGQQPAGGTPNQASPQPAEAVAVQSVPSDQLSQRPRAGSEPLDYKAADLCCVNCGEQLPAGAVYCASCGMKISGPGTGPTSKSQGTAVIQMITDGGQVGDTYTISSTGINIGRIEGEVTFPHDGYMSGRHARIIERDGEYFLVDQNSRNGTFIRIRGEIELKPGDTFLVGKQVFRFGRK